MHSVRSVFSRERRFLLNKKPLLFFNSKGELLAVPPYFTAASQQTAFQAAFSFTSLCMITYATYVASYFLLTFPLAFSDFSAKLQDVFTSDSFMRLSSAGSFLSGCFECYFFFSKPFYICRFSVCNPNVFAYICQAQYKVKSPLPVIRTGLFQALLIFL